MICDRNARRICELVRAADDEIFKGIFVVLCSAVAFVKIEPVRFFGRVRQQSLVCLLLLLDIHFLFFGAFDKVVSLFVYLDVYIHTERLCESICDLL